MWLNGHVTVKKYSIDKSDKINWQSKRKSRGQIFCMKKKKHSIMKKEKNTSRHFPHLFSLLSFSFFLGFHVCTCEIAHITFFIHTYTWTDATQQIQLYASSLQQATTTSLRETREKGIHYWCPMILRRPKPFFILINLKRLKNDHAKVKVCHMSHPHKYSLGLVLFWYLFCVVWIRHG